LFLLHAVGDKMGERGLASPVTSYGWSVTKRIVVKRIATLLVLPLMVSGLQAADYVEEVGKDKPVIRKTR